MRFNTNANLNTTKNIDNQKLDESLITSSLNTFENALDDLCSVVNTDTNEDISAMKSRLTYENNLLQENVKILRDENELLCHTMEI